MKIHPASLPGVLIIEPRVFGDERGFFLESYQAARYAEAGLPERFVQDNHSCSVPRTIRGLHYQLRCPQGKLVRVIRGRVYDAAVDVRRRSPTFGRWIAIELSADNHLQLYIPPGFAHGFCVPGEVSEVEYKCTDYYEPGDQHGIAWNDSTLAIDWPITDPIVSPQDAAFEPFSAERADLPLYESTLT